MKEILLPFLDFISCHVFWHCQRTEIVSPTVEMYPTPAQVMVNGEGLGTGSQQVQDLVTLLEKYVLLN